MVCFVLITCGSVLLWRQRRRLGRILLGMGLAVLIIFSNRGIADVLIRALEQRYPPVIATSISDCHFIAVLGGGHGDDPRQPWTNRLANSSLARLVEAVRLAQLNPQAQLIFCGPAAKDQLSHAAVLAGAAQDLGLDPQRFHLVTEVRDTHDEVWAIRELVGAQNVALVTSAWHMPRAMGLARGAALNAIACPADYFSPLVATKGSMWFDFGLESLLVSNRAFREYLGLTWTALRGQR